MQLLKVQDYSCPIEAGLLRIAREQCQPGAKIFLAPLGWKVGDALIPVTVEAIYDEEVPVAICRDAADERWALWFA